MTVVHINPRQRIEALKLSQFHEQQRCAAWINLLQDACRVPDADYRRIQSAFDAVAHGVNKISDIGAELAALEKVYFVKRAPFFEVAKSICAPTDAELAALGEQVSGSLDKIAADLVSIADDLEQAGKP